MPRKSSYSRPLGARFLHTNDRYQTGNSVQSSLVAFTKHLCTSSVHTWSNSACKSYERKSGTQEPRVWPCQTERLRSANKPEIIDVLRCFQLWRRIAAHARPRPCDFHVLSATTIHRLWQLISARKNDREEFCAPCCCDQPVLQVHNSRWNGTPAQTKQRSWKEVQVK